MLAIVSAMHEEIACVLESLQGVQTQDFGQRRFHAGRFAQVEAVAVFSRYGKVAAAATVTQLLAAYPVSELVFSGVAGGVRRGLAIGDVVVASGLLQHDMDASPIFPRYEVPLLGKAVFGTDQGLSERLMSAAREFLAEDLPGHVARAEREFFHIDAPQVIHGLIASGDKFFSNAAEAQALRQRLPQVCCVEMEGAAVAQVCDEYSIPFAVLRTISDSADENSVHDFPRFARGIAAHYSAGILARFVANR
ncbi:MAG TPA: 5'-methylthioadenosine/adenosylhomocysteine nucleosidase [Steroidobacteraceae bacterium]|jgi:adenosylhomocysteine nucleosidase|nr:5'-methylthioadenosine/adenosylhomocysteine nucleosidase [Steroidobacteraceae bacterium]